MARSTQYYDANVPWLNAFVVNASLRRLAAIIWLLHHYLQRSPATIKLRYPEANKTADEMFAQLQNSIRFNPQIG